MSVSSNSGQDTNYLEKGSPIIQEEPSSRLEKVPPRTWNQLFSTIILILDAASCVFFLSGHAIVLTKFAPMENPDNGRFSMSHLLNTVPPFYYARSLGITIDVIFRIEEACLFKGVEYIDDNLRKKYKELLNTKEWAVSLGRIVSTALFVGLCLLVGKV